VAEQRQSPESAVSASVMIATRCRGARCVKVVLHVRVCVSTSRSEVVLPCETCWCHISIHVYDRWRFGDQDCIGGASWGCSVLVHRYLEIARFW
jgi:hypothetical protein